MADNIPVEGNLDLKGNQIKNGGFEVVTSLPTTNNFVGRHVTYQGRDYIWDGSAWKCDSDYLEIGGRNYIRKFNSWNRLGGFTYDSSDESLNISNTINYYNHSESNNIYLLDNTTYTLSLEVPIINGNCIIELQSRPDAVGNNCPVKTLLHSGINEFTFNSGVLPVGFTHYTLRFFGYIETLPITVKIRNIKLERGNIATDWTPAPEDKANENQSINYDLSTEPNETGTKTKISNTLWQNLFAHTNFLWGKIKDLFTVFPLTGNNGYLPKIDDVNKKLIKSNIQDDCSRVQIDSPLRVNSKTYYNVAQKISTNFNETGTIYIELPFGWTYNMGTYEIDIYNYSQNKAKVIVSGYNYDRDYDSGVWISPSLQIVGSLPSNVVRLGYNTSTSKCCILIGTTSTVWSYPQIYVSKVTQGFYNTDDWSTGWTISVITDESNITAIVQPTANVGMMLDGKTLTDQIADNDGRYLGINATAADSDKLDGKHATKFAQLEDGNQIKNVAIDIVTSLPTTDIVGRQVTYEGRSYIWDGANWKNDSDYLEIGGRNYIPNGEIKKIDGWYPYNSALNIESDSLRIVGNNIYVGTYVSFTKLMDAQRDVTISLYIKNNKNESQQIGIFPNGHYTIILGIIQANSDWVKLEKTYKPADAQVDKVNSNNVYIFSQGDCDFQIKNVKIEYGNITTDWTPAPEDKANVNQTINFDTNNIEPTQSGTVTKTSTWLWQYLTQSVNFLWLKLKDLFPSTQATTHNYIPKIDNALKKLVKSNINDDGTTLSYEGNLDLKGNQIKNGGFEVVSSLPTAPNNFIGRQVTYEGRSYIWDGSAWKCDADTLGGYALNDVKKYIASRGENLISNGSALMGNNLNFSQFTFDGSQAYYSGGSFKFIGNGYPTTDELMPVNPNIKYKLDFFAKSLNAVGRYYAFIGCYDVDGLSIDSHSHMYIPNTLTTLAQPLNNGDTIVYLTSAANWDNTGINSIYTKSFIFWDYVNSFGYLYPPQTYSRHNSSPDMWANGSVNTSNNTITLKSPWSGGTVAAGTQLSNGNYGGTYKYIALGYTQLPTIWTNYNDVMDGVDLSGQNLGNKFPPGTSKVRVGFLMDYNNAGDTAWFTNVSFAIDLDTNQTINFDTSNIEPTQSGTVTKTSTWLWQYLTQSVNFLWLKLKDLFPSTQATTHNYIPKIDNALKKLVKSNIYDDGTNIGIGTTSPSKKLDVNGILKLGLDTNVLLGLSANVSNRTSLTLNSTTGNPADLIFKNGSIISGNYGQWAISARNGNTDYRFSIWRGGENGEVSSESEVFSIVPSGNVGIGTTTPSEKLHVNGNVKADGYKVGSGTDTKLLTDGGGTKPITDFADVNHNHNYTTSTDVSNLINTAIASVYKPKGNIANKTALLALTNIKQGDVYNAQASFTLTNGQNIQNVKVGDNIVCLSDAATSEETNWDNLGGNIDFAAALSQALIGFGATSGDITSSDTILSAINKLAYDKHIHSNLNVLNLTTAAFTTEFKDQLSQAYSDSHSHSNKTILDAIQVALTNTLKANYDTAYTHSQSTHAPTDARTNRTIKVEGIDKAGSLTTIPLNFKSGDGLINIEGQVNSGILDIIFSSVNTLSIYGDLDPQDLRDVKTGVHELIEGNLYYFTPNPICGTDIDSDSLFGKLIVLKNIDETSKTLYYHSYITNKIHVCSGYDNGSEFVWSNWERLLTCKDETNVVIGEEGVYSYTIDGTNTEINIDPNFDPKSDIIKVEISSFKDIIPAYICFEIIFSTPITGGVTVVINNGTSKTINYTQFYQNPSAYTGAMFEIQYKIWNRYSDWLYHNRIL